MQENVRKEKKCILSYHLVMLTIYNTICIIKSLFINQFPQKGAGYKQSVDSFSEITNGDGQQMLRHTIWKQHKNRTLCMIHTQPKKYQVFHMGHVVNLSLHWQS